MSDAITELSSEELDAVGAGIYINASTNVKWSSIYQDNHSKVYAVYSKVSVNNTNNVGTTIVVGD